MPDVVVIGAGVVGAACAYFAARAGLDVTVVDRGSVAGGTTGSGEGNVLVSDKEPGPELDLAVLSSRLWAGLAAEHGGFEHEPKGGLVVAEAGPVGEALGRLAAAQAGAGVESVPVGPAELRDYEPHLAEGLAGGVFYPGDAQVQPMLAAARLIRCAGEIFGRRVTLRTGVTVIGFLRSGGFGRSESHTTVTGSGEARVRGVKTNKGDIWADAVINAAGTWGGDVARLAGLDLPILPRRGFILVTEPLSGSPAGPPGGPGPSTGSRSWEPGTALVRHKVYTAAYVTGVASDSADLETSAVVESTWAGNVLIGASRERVGFDRTVSLPVLSRLARQAIALFPALAGVRAIRAYCGFRPYCPDHMPVIGEDLRAPGLHHACGHEGAGIGLAAATGHLIAQTLTGARPDLDLTPFRPGRFEEAVA